MNSKEELFWELVNEIGWGIKTTDYNRIKKQLKHRHSQQFRSSMRKFAIKKRQELAIILDDYSIKHTDSGYGYWGVGDDGFWDLTAHIVGLGKGNVLFYL